jgi:S-adenosylmethionine-diacylglycerol 3-amino-3-carboxypropyl transferase
METIPLQIRKIWFEVRIFISLSIVVTITSLSLTVFRNSPSTIEIAGGWLGLSGGMSLRYGYFVIALLVCIASLLRMWAGSILTSDTVMAFRIRNTYLTIAGPYNFVRNPIYSADLIAFTALSLCLSPIGLLIPALIRLHYCQLIRYEQEKLIGKFGESYKEYIHSTPALFPGINELKKLFKIPLNFIINFDGFRHNAQYLLFIPGLLVSAFTGKFIHAIIIGLPGVLDWAIIHTIKGVGAGSPVKAKPVISDRKLTRSKVFSDILYAQCWEDPEMDRTAFNIRPGDKIFTITSGGCNALTFLIDDPAEVICLDMNRYQNYLLSLKVSAFKSLDYNELLEFFGVKSSERRWELYEKIQPSLPAVEHEYWSARKNVINTGIIHCGRYERYMHILKKIFRFLIGGKVISELFNSTDSDERRLIFNKKWDTFRWRLFSSVFLSRIFAGLFFDKAFYKYLDPSFSFEKYYRSAVRRAITEHPVRDNYFLAYILLGNYFENNLPPYLRKENYELIRDRADRIKTVTSDCTEYLKSLPPDTISEFNFTNIFEWMPDDEFSLILEETIRSGRDGSVLTYRNHLVTRNRPEYLADRIIPDTKLSVELHETDRSFIYKAYVVERIKKQTWHTL